MGTTRAEIHRMKVRYSHVRKTHEKLTGDLEIRVSRRDTIAVQTRTRERKACKSSHNTRHCFKKKLDDTRIKVKQMNSEIKTVELRIEDV